MNGKGWTLAGFATLLGALALNGKAALEAVAGLPAVLQAFSGALPGGVLSFLLSFIIAALVWYRADGQFRMGKGGEHGRNFAAENLSLLVACAVTMAQTLATTGPSSGALLQALMLGILAGLLAPLAGKGVLAVVRRQTP